MSPIALLALIGLSVFLPIFTNDDDDGADAVDPVDPVDPAGPATPVDPVDPIEPMPTEPVFVTEQNGVITGTQGNDTLFASEQSPTVNGGAGNDALFSLNDGVQARLDGGDGDDALVTSVLVGFPDLTDGTQTLTGGAGTDSFLIDLDVTRFSTEDVDGPLVTVTDFKRGEEQLTFNVNTFAEAFQFEGVTQDIAPGGNSTDFNFRFSDSDSILDDLIATVRVDGVAGLNESEFTVNDGRVLVEGTDGNDTIRTTDANLGRTGLDTLSGGAGDDVLIQDPTDDAGQVILDGGTGNDTLLASEVEFRNPTTLDGGAGDDVLRSDIFLGGSSSNFDTFITGEGADRIEITTLNASGSDSIDLGLIGIVTDFTLGEDMIFVDPSQVIREIVAIDDNEDEIDFLAEFTNEFTLNEDTAGGFTNLEFTFTAIRTGDQMTGVIRLDGLTGITEDDIAFGQLENAAPLFMRDDPVTGI
jgi:Ca2+-binding RTX toxin-like protein